MNRLFNSDFEISLRLLTVMSHSKKKLSLDDAVALDFITIYAAQFNISNENLHGNKSFMYSEFTSLRKVAKTAVKYLVLKGLISPSLDTDNGFLYSSTPLGDEFSNSLENEYSVKYRQLLNEVLSHTSSTPNINLTEFIYANSVKGGN